MTLIQIKLKQLTVMALISLFFSSPSRAQTNAQSIVQTNVPSITAAPSDKTFEDVKLSDSILIEDRGTKTNLKSVSFGLRKVKKFGLVTVSAYVLEFFAKNPTQLIKTNEGILNSLKTSGPVQLRLTLARDLKGSQISDSFKESLKANEIDTTRTTAELAAVLTAVNEVLQFTKGEVFSLTANWADNTATLFIQSPDQSIQKITGPEKFVTDLFSIWFGQPVDDKMEDLKKTLIK